MLVSFASYDLNLNSMHPTGLSGQRPQSWRHRASDDAEKKDFLLTNKRNKIR